MRYEPYPYQSYATDFILQHDACALFLDMGMGKSVITLTALAQLLYDSFETRRVLVIAPLRVAQEVWAQEAKKWDHLAALRVARVLGAQQQRLAALDEDADIYVVNRENVEWLVNHYRKAWPFDTVVIDELSSFKDAGSKRFRALRKVRRYIRRVIGLTGTPTSNGLIDLWPQIYLLDQGEALGKTVTAYRQTFFTPGARNGNVVFDWRPQPGADERIQAALKPLCISMRIGDYVQMPERLYVNHAVTMGPEAYSLYRRMERDAIIPYADGDIDAVNAAVLAGKLLQMAGGEVYDEQKRVRHIHDAKLTMLGELVEEANGQPMLVYYNFQHECDRIQRWFPQATHISTPGAIERWCEGRESMLLAHPASAGHGLNLQSGGHIMVWFSLPWSLELYQQACARLYRLGQTHTVLIHAIITGDTYDEKAVRALTRKGAQQEALLDAVQAKIKEYGKDDAA